MDEMLQILSEEVGPMVPIRMADPRAPAVEYRFADGIGKVGFIASVTKPFCGNCNRLRLTADGKLRYCLFAIEETDLRSILRQGGDDEDIDRAIRTRWSRSGRATRFRRKPSFRRREKCAPLEADSVIRVLFFGMLRDIVGTREEACELPAMATLGGVFDDLCDPLPAAARTAAEHRLGAESAILRSVGAGRGRR